MTDGDSSVENKFTTLLQDVAQRNGFTEYEIKFDNSISIISGFSSSMTNAQIVSKSKELDLIIKSCDSDDRLRTLVPMDLIYKREIYMYESIFPLLQNFEIEHGVKLSHFAPTCYKTSSNAIVLNNMTRIGYSIYNKPGFLDENHMKVSLLKYAHFHAASLAYRDQNPLKFNDLLKPMENFFEQLYKDSGVTAMYVKQIQRAGTMLDPVLDKDAKSVLDKFLLEAEDFLIKAPVDVDEFCSIIHSDCWKNNIMFKYGELEDPSTPSDACLIDFQISRLGSPIQDVANFLYACSSKNLLDNVYKYVELYYDCLSSRLQELGSDPQKVYPRSVMKRHWQKFARIGLIVRPVSIHVILGDQKQFKRIADVVRTDGNLDNMFNFDVTDELELRDLFKHTVLHFVENQLI